jgi:hypothetical protein
MTTYRSSSRADSIGTWLDRRLTDLALSMNAYEFEHDQPHLRLGSSSLQFYALWRYNDLP